MFTIYLPFEGKSARVEKAEPEIRKYLINDTLEIECKFDGNPLPYIKWTKSNQTVNLNDARISVNTNR